MRTNNAETTYPHITWIGGAPCAGKSSITEIIAQRCAMHLYHVDDMLGEHLPKFTPETQPMMTKWTATPWNDLWMRPVDILLDEVIRAYREHSEFVFADLQALPQDKAILAEGNVLMPDDLLNFAGPGVNTLWIVPTEAFLRERYPQRGEWVQGILATCDDPDAALENWMARDAAFAAWIAERAQTLGLPVIVVDGSHSIEENANRVMDLLKLRDWEVKQ